MADKGDGEGEGSILKLENQIAVLKYVLLFTNVLEWENLEDSTASV
ncbi:hypothetical protein YQE_01248, partial [Dendroctonus ponderosae]